jgi:chorismate mutase
MANGVQCDSLEMVRGQIDRVDRLMLALLAEHAALHPPST